MEALHTLTVVQLRKAISLKEDIERMESQLAAIFAGGATSKKASGKRKMSRAARAAIAAAQRARWAKVKGAKATVAPKKRRKISAAGRAKIAATAKARWAKAKAAGKKSLKSS